jgi:hypothetical protein
LGDPIRPRRDALPGRPRCSRQPPLPCLPLTPGKPIIARVPACRQATALCTVGEPPSPNTG